MPRRLEPNAVVEAVVTAAGVVAVVVTDAAGNVAVVAIVAVVTRHCHRQQQEPALQLACSSMPSMISGTTPP